MGWRQEGNQPANPEAELPGNIVAFAEGSQPIKRFTGEFSGKGTAFNTFRKAVPDRNSGMNQHRVEEKSCTALHNFRRVKRGRDFENFEDYEFKTAKVIK